MPVIPGGIEYSPANNGNAFGRPTFEDGVLVPNMGEMYDEAVDMGTPIPTQRMRDEEMKPDADDFWDEHTPVELIREVKLATLGVRSAYDYGDEAISEAAESRLRKARLAILVQRFGRQTGLVE